MGAVLRLLGDRWFNAGDWGLVYVIVCALLVTLLLQLTKTTITGLLWNGIGERVIGVWDALTPRRAEFRKFKADLSDTHKKVRRVISGAGTEDAYKAMEATVNLFERADALYDCPLPVPSTDVKWLEAQWYPVLLTLKERVENGGQRWYYDRKKSIRKRLSEAGPKAPEASSGASGGAAE